ncbi:MAG: LytTR family DNA-binding domain-containing protein [Chitinophagaceae bacterium]|nr:LytTR family DNA-binding domain-containing protein [Chitinophagaceae bacterium]
MKAIIVEDEHLIAEEMKATIQAIAPDIEVLNILPSIKSSIKWFKENKEPDLVFMDIKLSDGLSFEIFEEMSLQCPVIFCTAYEEYAIRAFKVNGVDYLLKPVQEDDLAKAIEKVRGLKQGNTSAPPDMQQLINLFTQTTGNKPQYKERFIIKSHNKWIPIEVKEIALIYRENINFFYRFNGEKLIYDFSSLEEIEEVLDPDLFFRANRQTIVNINAIQSAKPYGNQKLMVQLKAPLKMELDISREKAPLLKKWLDR